MSQQAPERGASDASARQFRAVPPEHEVVPRSPAESVRWHRHDYPSPIARWNYHPEYELHLITDDSGSYIVGNTIDRYGPGQLVLVPPYVPHHWISGRVGPGAGGAAGVIRGRDVVLQFRREWLLACVEAQPEVRSLLHALDARAATVFTGATRAGIAELMCRGVDLGDLQRVVSLWQVFAAIADAPDEDVIVLSTGFVADTAIGSGSHLAITETVDFMFSHLDGRLRLADIAARAGMSESSFSRWFHRASGITFTSMVTRMRLSKAAQLLTTTDLRISDVAARAGFTNLSNFNRRFLDEYGMTPSRLRKAEAGDPEN